MTHHGLLCGVMLVFTSPDRARSAFPPGCVLEMGLDTGIPYHYTNTGSSTTRVEHSLWCPLETICRLSVSVPDSDPLFHQHHLHRAKTAFSSTYERYFIKYTLTLRLTSISSSSHLLLTPNALYILTPIVTAFDIPSLATLRCLLRGSL